MQNSEYQIVGKKDSKELAKFLAKEGQFLLPMLELIEQAQIVVDEVIDCLGRSAIEAILLLSAQQVGGPQHKGKNTGDILWCGRQKGVVPLAERKLRVDKPRLRRKGKGAKPGNCDTGISGDAYQQPTQQEDTFDIDAGYFDSLIQQGFAGDGGDCRYKQVECQQGIYRSIAAADEGVCRKKIWRQGYSDNLY